MEGEAVVWCGLKVEVICSFDVSITAKANHRQTKIQRMFSTEHVSGGLGYANTALLFLELKGMPSDFISMLY